MATETHNARFYGVSLQVNTSSFHEHDGFPIHASSVPSSPVSADSCTLDRLRHSLQNFSQSRFSLARKHNSPFSGLSSNALSSRLQEAYTWLRQKDEDLKLASEIGTLLIDKNEDLTVQLANAEAKISSLTTDLSSTQEQRQEEKARMRQLQHKHEHLNFEHEELLANVAKLKTQLERESTQRGQLQQTVHKVEDHAEQEVQTLRINVQTLQKQVEALTFQNLKCCKALEESDDALSTITEEVTVLRDQVKRLSHTEIQFQKASLAAAETEKLRAIVADLQWENQQFAKSIRELQFENTRLAELHEKDIQIFTEMQNELDLLREESDDPDRLLRNLNSDAAHRSMMHMSVADELMAEHKRLARDFEVSYEDMSTQTDLIWAENTLLQNLLMDSTSDSLSSPSMMPRPDVDPHRADREAKMEFFMLSVLTVKINMGGRMDVVCTKSNRELYEEAMKERVPFHQFQDWIERALMKAYIDTTCRIDPKILTETERASVKAIDSPRLSQPRHVRARGNANSDDSKSEVGSFRRSVSIMTSPPPSLLSAASLDESRALSTKISRRISLRSANDSKPVSTATTQPAPRGIVPSK